VSESSRRTFLKGIAIAGAAGLAAPLLASGADAATAAGTLIYGINNENYAAFTKDNPKGFAYSYRAYDDTVWESAADVPTTWITANPTDYVNWSVRPNLRLLLAGEFDAAIRKLLKTAPDHAELTMWHEAAAPPACGPGNEYAKYAPKSIGGTATDGTWMTAANLKAGHAHMRKLCAQTRDSNGGNVTHGQIFIGPADQHQVGDWIAGGLYWYGIDIYDNKVYWKNPRVTNPAKSVLDQAAINARMTGNKTFLDGIAKGYKLHITETNSPVIQHRKNWALYLSEWMSSNGGYRFQWFYHKGGKLSGAYSDLEPSTRAYIADTIIPRFGKRT
jgi:hypothetical protein